MKSSYVIIEEDEESLQKLSFFIQQSYAKELTFLGVASTYEDALDLLVTQRPKLVLMDIPLGSSNAFELLKALPNYDFDIIITTAHQEYALNAIKLSVLDFLLKPVTEDDLNIAIQKHLQSQKISNLRLEVLLEHFEKNKPKKITVPSLNGYEFLEIGQIIHCQSDINYTHIFLKNNIKLTVAKTLKEFEQLLAPHNFFRIHNSHLVNLDEIIRFNKGKGGYVQLKDHTMLEVSIRRKDELLKALKVKNS